MLHELTKIEESRGEREVAALIRAANYLIRNQFLVAHDRGGAAHFDRLSNPRYSVYFTSLFDALGYKFVTSEEENWVGLIPDTDDDLSWPKMKLDETIVLLLLALRWREGLESGALEDGAVVETSFNELFIQYQEIINQTRKTAVPVSRFAEIIDEYARRGLVKKGDREDEDVELTIRPIVNTLVGGDVVARLERFCDAELDELARQEAYAEDEAEESAGEPDDAAEEDSGEDA